MESRVGAPRKQPHHAMALLHGVRGAPSHQSQDISRAARSFKARTSIGVGSFPPRALQWLSSPLFLAAADFLNLVEATGDWPTAVSGVLLFLIPKPSGGRRPVAVMATIARIWEKARRPTIRQWAGKNRKDQDRSTSG